MRTVLNKVPIGSFVLVGLGAIAFGVHFHEVVGPLCILVVEGIIALCAPQLFVTKTFE